VDPWPEPGQTLGLPGRPGAPPSPATVPVGRRDAADAPWVSEAATPAIAAVYRLRELAGQAVTAAERAA
jgi:hypothetical protein